MLDVKELRRQFDLIRKRQAALIGNSDEDIFPVWILLALASATEQEVATAICGGPYDGEMDAIFVDEKAVWIVQGKLRGVPGKTTESAKAVRDFAALAKYLYEDPKTPSNPEFWRHLERNTRGAAEKFRKASKAVRLRDLPVRLIFASTGRFNPNVESDVENIVKRVATQASISLLDFREIAQHLTNYIRDVAPAVPSLRLKVVSGELRSATMGDSTLQAWTLATTAEQVASLQRQGGEQIFARNIRHGLGDKVHVNRAIRRTLEKEPQRFWFLNNGLTITCESARMEGDDISMKGAQIINGQQTTRTITEVMRGHSASHPARDARVAVRVISFERVAQLVADRLVAQVVEATNFQNAISKADLRSNDIRQIELARELQARGYLFIRKRGKQESPNGLNFLKYRITREELFTAVAGTLEESIALREGRTPLFDSDLSYYDRIINMNTDSLLAAWFCWKRVNSCAYGDSFKQAAKYLVHYHAFQALRTGVGQFDRMVKRLEQNDEEVGYCLDDIIEAYFAGAAQSYKVNKRRAGKALLPKPYHQSEKSSGYFETIWRSGKCSRFRAQVREAAHDLKEMLKT